MNWLKKIYIVLGMAICVPFQFCMDALDIAPDGFITLDEIFADNDKTSAYLNSCYGDLPDMGVKFRYWCRGLVVWSDEAWDTDAETEPGLMSGLLYRGNASASYHPILNVSAENGNGDYWTRYWAAIRKCAVFITRIDQAAVNSESDRRRWKAEAHVLRAFYYSELLRWFGTGLPIVRKAYTMDVDFSTITKESYYDVVKFILEDCDIALATSELPWRITTDAERVRVTKALAEAIKSRMILYAASPLYNEGENHWEEAYQVNKTSLQNLRDNGYALYNKVNFPTTYKDPNAFLPSDPSALYNEYFTQNMEYSASPADKETIYQGKNDQGDIQNVDGIGAMYNLKTGTCPSQELVDAYETTDGQPILDLADPYRDERHLEPNYNPENTLYDPENPYENRDPRFYASIYYNGSKRKCYWPITESKEQSPENYPGTPGNRIRIIATYPEEPYTGLAAIRRTGTRTGYYERKFLHPFSGNDLGVKGARFKMFRLGEVILNFAEAAAEAGHLPEAIAAVNEIRARAGMPALPSNITREKLILRIRNERRVELALEGFRYYDVRRWSTPDGDLSKTDKWLTAMRVKREVDENGNFLRYTYSRQVVNQRLCYENKFLWIPIPMGDANTMEALTGVRWQNPGW